MDLSKLKDVKLTPRNVRSRGARKFRASLINNVWCGVCKKGTYPIRIPLSICNQIHYYFSSANNDYYELGTPRRHDKLFADNYVDYGFFIPFREGFEFTGVLNANNKINVNWKDHQIRVKEIYGKYIAKEAKRMSRGS